MKQFFCTLEQAIQLKDLGIKQLSLFYFFPNPNTNEIQQKYNLDPYQIRYGKEFILKDYDTIQTNVLNGIYNKTYSAFTASELILLLFSKATYIKRQLIKLNDNKNLRSFYYSTKIRFGLKLYESRYINEAESLAELLIKLIQDEIITPALINKILEASFEEHPKRYSKISIIEFLH